MRGMDQGLDRRTPTSVFCPPSPTPWALTDPIRALLGFVRVANEHRFDARDPLPDAQLDRAFEMGLRSLRPTFGQIFQAMIGWTVVLTRAAEPRMAVEFDGPISVAETGVLREPVDRVSGSRAR